MALSDSPCLSLAITRLNNAGTKQYAIWVLNAPYPAGYVLRDCIWPDSLSQAWQAWQEMFSLRGLPDVPHISSAPDFSSAPLLPAEGSPLPYGGRLMQHLGINLWQWIFEGAIQSSLDQSQGIAIGQAKPLRLRLEIRDPDLIALPWEIMQSQPGTQAISLSQQLLFSRTTSNVAPLPPLRLEQSLKILLVLGQEAEPERKVTNPPDAPVSETLSGGPLDLDQEAHALTQILMNYGSGQPGGYGPLAPSKVHTLIQPTPAELIEALETGDYNILFYAGHGMPGPDGGLLLLRSGTTLSGTELAQVLTRCRVTLAVFNACWGAQPDQSNNQAIPRSSLAEVMIHHGVPAVLAMRDSITDQEALSFIHAFAQALGERLPIDQAVAVARQHLLTLYKFNQPAWTLPVLYMHPEFDGQLIKPLEESMTELPGTPTWLGRQTSAASLRSVGTMAKVWPIRGGLMRVGSREENDLVLQEPGVSRQHAEIFCRDAISEENSQPTYFLRDFSRYGTLIFDTDGWQKIHHQVVPLRSGIQLKFGNPRGQTLEFVVENPMPESDP